MSFNRLPEKVKFNYRSQSKPGAEEEKKYDSEYEDEDGVHKKIKKLGEGGSGSVYQFFNAEKKINSAIKTLRQSMLDADATAFVNRVKHEAQLSKEVYGDSRFEISYDRDVAWITLPFLSGTTFENYLAELKDLDETKRDFVLEAVTKQKMYIQALEFLDDIHGHGITHRDISLRNIIVDPEKGTGYVCDIGHGEKTGSEVDQCQYIRFAPEIREADTLASPAQDVYSAGYVFAQIIDPEIDLFKDIIAAMMAENPEQRISLAVAIKEQKKLIDYFPFMHALEKADEKKIDHILETFDPTTALMALLGKKTHGEDFYYKILRKILAKDPQYNNFYGSALIKAFDHEDPNVAILVRDTLLKISDKHRLTLILVDSIDQSSNMQYSASKKMWELLLSHNMIEVLYAADDLIFEAFFSLTCCTYLKENRTQELYELINKVPVCKKIILGAYDSLMLEASDSGNLLLVAFYARLKMPEQNAIDSCMKNLIKSPAECIMLEKSKPEGDGRPNISLLCQLYSSIQAECDCVSISDHEKLFLVSHAHFILANYLFSNAPELAIIKPHINAAQYYLQESFTLKEACRQIQNLVDCIPFTRACRFVTFEKDCARLLEIKTDTTTALMAVMAMENTIFIEPYKYISKKLIERGPDFSRVTMNGTIFSIALGMDDPILCSMLFEGIIKKSFPIACALLLEIFEEMLNPINVAEFKLSVFLDLLVKEKALVQKIAKAEPKRFEKLVSETLKYYFSSFKFYLKMVEGLVRSLGPFGKDTIIAHHSELMTTALEQKEIEIKKIGYLTQLKPPKLSEISPKQDAGILFLMEENKYYEIKKIQHYYNGFSQAVVERLDLEISSAVEKGDRVKLNLLPQAFPTLFKKRIYAHIKKSIDHADLKDLQAIASNLPQQFADCILLTEKEEGGLCERLVQQKKSGILDEGVEKWLTGILPEFGEAIREKGVRPGRR